MMYNIFAEERNHHNVIMINGKKTSMGIKHDCKISICTLKIFQDEGNLIDFPGLLHLLGG